MSSIFKASNIETGEIVALKIPQAEAESDVVFYDRFQREAAIGREMNHPGIPKVKVEAQQPSRLYFAMEWVEGTSLRQVLQREGKLPVDQAMAICVAICDVLTYIHERGVVHRDLKPENVVIGADQTVKLIDFGIAAKAGARRLTFGKLSNLMGTADYISPEQVKGQRGDARSDLYALGVTLYEMLTGQMPFRGTNPLAVMNDRLLRDPIPANIANPDLPPAWQTIVQRLLQRNPKDRYQSACALAFDLENPSTLDVPEPSKRPIRSRDALLYSCLALVPATVFLMLLYVARHQ
jgi:serine/threonine protein kinase